MGVTRERFHQGMTYQGFKDSMTVNRERFEENERNLQLKPDDLKPFQDLPKPVNVLVVAADWCADVIANMPILGLIAEESGKLNLSVFERDSNLDIMNQYLNKGMYQSIPTFVFFDDDFNELAVWIERPASVTTLREQRRLQLYTEHPEFGPSTGSINELPEEVRQRVRQGVGRIREETKELGEQEVVRELREIVEAISAGQHVRVSSLPGG